MLGNLWYAIGIILAISESSCCRKPSIKFLFKRMYGLDEDVGWRVLRWLLVHDHLWYLNGRILAVLSLKGEKSFKDVVLWRLPRWLNSAWPSLISKWKDFSYSESQGAYSFEDAVWRIPWRLFIAWPPLVSKIYDLSISLIWLMVAIKYLPKRTYG